MIHLDYRDSRPIYQQVKEQMRTLMVNGIMASGEKLPSVRSLATDLAINPNTIQRAYMELEQEGFILSVTGKGSFVAELDNLREMRRQELLNAVAPQLRELKALGATEQDVLSLFRE